MRASQTEPPTAKTPDRHLAIVSNPLSNPNTPIENSLTHTHTHNHTHHGIINFSSSIGTLNLFPKYKLHTGNDPGATPSQTKNRKTWQGTSSFPQSCQRTTN